MGCNAPDECDLEVQGSDPRCHNHEVQGSDPRSRDQEVQGSNLRLLDLEVQGSDPRSEDNVVVSQQVDPFYWQK